MDEVRRYIRTQKEHHARISFQDELVRLLKKHRIAFDEKYLLGRPAGLLSPLRGFLRVGTPGNLGLTPQALRAAPSGLAMRGCAVAARDPERIEPRRAGADPRAPQQPMRPAPKGRHRNSTLSDRTRAWPLWLSRGNLGVLGVGV